MKKVLVGSNQRHLTLLSTFVNTFNEDADFVVDS